MANYPPGVTDAHPYFNPPVCEECGAGIDEDGDCLDGCGGHVYTPEEIAEIRAESEYERRRDEGEL